MKTYLKRPIILQIILLRQPQYWKPLLLLLSIFILREGGGKSSVFLYTVYMFRSAGVNIDPMLCTMYVGIARVLTIFICALVIDKVGRKFIFLTCTIICTISLVTAGIALESESSNIVVKWIPVIAVLTFTISYCLGMSPIPWPLLAELLPLPVRPFSTSLACFTYSISLFGITSVFPSLLSSLGLGKSFLIFSISYFALIILVIMFLPETKGKTLTELEHAFVNKKNVKPLPNLSHFVIQRRS